MELIIHSLLETITMIVASLLIGSIGIPLGVYIYHISEIGLNHCPFKYRIISGSINIFRSIPYIILIVVLIPITRFILGTSIGTFASSFSLGISAFLMITRATEDSLSTVSKDKIDIGLSFKANNNKISFSSILWKIIFFESIPNLIKNLTTITVSLVGFSAMAGAVGGGGLGDLAIRYGYQRYDVWFLLYIVLVLISLVQIIQITGAYFSKKLTK